VLFVLFNGSSLAKYKQWERSDYIVGHQPLAIFIDPFVTFDSTNQHPFRNYWVICAGYDANFNGIEDNGDEKPSIWRLTELMPYYTMIPQKIIDLDFVSIVFPFRGAYFNPKVNNLDTSGRLFFTYKNQVRCFDFLKAKFVEDIIIDFAPVAVSYDTTFLFLSMRNTNGTSEVLKYDLVNKKITDTISAGKNVQMTLSFYKWNNNKKYLAILNEGSFGNDDSSVQLVEMESDGTKTSTSFTVGSGGNYLDYDFKNLIVTVNGSGKIVFIDPESKTITNEIQLQTGQYDGPRQTTLISGSLWISSYSNDIFASSLNSTIESIPARGKTESITGFYFPADDYRVFTTNIFLKDSYKPDSTISMFKDYSLDITEQIQTGNVSIYPNPVNDLLNLVLDFENGNPYLIKIEIAGIEGQVLYEKVFEMNDGNSFRKSIPVQSPGLNSGTYFLRISAGDKFYVKPFVVVR